jgi:hypothetical protein
MIVDIFSEQLTVTEKFSMKLQELYNKGSVKESTEKGFLRALTDIQMSLGHLTHSVQQLANVKSSNS